MTAEKDPRDAAERFIGDLNFTRSLLLSAGDKVHLYLSNRALLSSEPCGRLLACQARDLGDLLILAQQLLDRMDRDVKTVTDFLYQLDWPDSVSAG